MALIEWDNEFAVGIPDVDIEHRALVELINGLHAQLESGSYGVNMVDFLGEVYAGMREHFTNEESIMRELDYSDYQEHKQDHERFLGRICKLMDEYQDGALTADAVMGPWLTHWFIDHFRVHDARLHTMLTARR